MKIIYYDGSVLTCSHIDIYGDVLIVDDIYEVPIIEINSITEDE